MAELVTVGVPVYRGELYLEETLRCIQGQTHRDLEVIMSIDGPDLACEKICRRFLDDSRFRLVVQPERLGWAGNISWLMSQAKGDFWYYHQQDDLTSEDYVEVLVDYARENPAAALAYCDMVAFGTHQGPIIVQPSVPGSHFMRQMALLHAPYHAVGFRGLTRVDAVRHAGGIPTNAHQNFACDTAWLAGVALSGELHRVPRVLYHKRYHAASTHLQWSDWDKQTSVAAWSAHCVNMLEQALRIEATAHEKRLLWLSAIERLLSPATAGMYLDMGELTENDRNRSFALFLAGARDSRIHDVAALLGDTWGNLQDWSRTFFRLALPEGRGALRGPVPSATPEGMAVARWLRRILTSRRS